MLPRAEVLRLLLPVLAGSFLTLSATYVSLSFSRSTQQQEQLRAGYADFLAAADETTDGLAVEQRGASRVFSQYLGRGGRLRPGRLRHADSLTLEADYRQGKSLLTHLRKTAFTVLLLEPVPDRRARVRAYVDSLLARKTTLDQHATLVRYLLETGSFDPAMAPNAAAAEDPLGAYREAAQRAATQRTTEYQRLLDEILADDRWR